MSDPFEEAPSHKDYSYLFVAQLHEPQNTRHWTALDL